MNCPHCDKPTSDIGKKCVHCGGEIHAPVQRSHDLPVKCPLCRIKTDIIRLAGIELDYCSNCSGIWFDKGEVSNSAGFNGFTPSRIVVAGGSMGNIACGWNLQSNSKI